MIGVLESESVHLNDKLGWIVQPARSATVWTAFFLINNFSQKCDPSHLSGPIYSTIRCFK